MNVEQNNGEIFSELIQKTSNFLLSSQVVFDPIEIKTNQHRYELISSKPCRKFGDLNFELKRKDQYFQIRTSKNQITVSRDQFFRVSANGQLGAKPFFSGDSNSGLFILNPLVSSNVHEDSEKLTWQISRTFKQVTVKFASYFKLGRLLLKKYRLRQVHSETKDLRYIEGITFRIRKLDNIDVLECYDHGGFYDHYLNAEGCYYPPQVPGNYYADVYAAFTFLHLHQSTKLEKWKVAAERALFFVKHTYPNYLPAKIAWHHSDFKNAGLLEIYLRYPNYRELIDSIDLTQDNYEPTNVFALRVHWKTLAKELNLPHRLYSDLNECIRRLKDDQTIDGLFHDNIETYKDAHDLTYHQYSTACLAASLDVTKDSVVDYLFRNAAQFSLNMVTPFGECAYTGRAANNIHQSASTIFAFSQSARIEKDPIQRASYFFAADKIHNRLLSYVSKDGMLPTCMNKQVDKRMAWNHCETPYNALTTFMLIRAESNFKGVGFDESKPILPIQGEGAYVADDAGYATLSNERFFLTLFSGCDRSYGWSEGKHITGVAGIAMFGRHDKHIEYPSLGITSEKEILVSDLPLINGEAPFGRGVLSYVSNTSIKLMHNYGGCRLVRTYKLEKQALKITTTIDTPTQIILDALIKLPFIGPIQFSRCKNSKYSFVYGESFKVKIHENNISFLRSEMNKKISNPKGFCNMLMWKPLNKVTSNLTYTYRVYI